MSSIFGVQENQTASWLRQLRPGTRTVIKNARLINGVGTSPIERASVLLNGRTIEAVVPGVGPVPNHPPTQVIDAQGKTVLPGLIDAHVHLSGETIHDPYRRYLMPSDGAKTIRAALDTQAAFKTGWTTLVDLGAGSAAVDIRTAIKKGWIPGPRILTAVAALSMSGGHGDYAIFPHEWTRTRRWRGRIVDGVDECRKAVRLNFREGADLTKVLVSSGMASTYQWPPVPEFSREELEAIVDETGRRHAKVAAHCMGGPSVRNAIAAGVNSIEHGIIEEKDFDVLTTMAERDIALVPTLSIIHYYHTEGVERGLAKWAAEESGRVLDIQAAMIRRAKAEGVRIVAGTDTGFLFGVGRHAKELELLSSAGLTPLEAIVAATKNAAAARGIGGMVGTIEPGKLGDLLVVRIDPLEDLRGLQDEKNIELVVCATEPDEPS